MFGSRGTPVLADLTLTIVEFILIVTMLRRLFVATDAFLKEMANSWTYATLARRLNRLDAAARQLGGEKTDEKE
jgi:hypothetical protein